nr:uncharacterized protein LOC123767468 isoform X1 [Procambarus clarkii]
MAEEGPVTYRAETHRHYFFLNENSFTLLRPDNAELLRGPRRVVRLCVFALVLPALLITIPLYVRLVLYPPGHYPMVPTDQRLLSRHVSSVWCQSQTTHMNGSHSTFLSSGDPATCANRSTYYMLHSITLQDDVKEYWGFHLLKGSKVTVSACSSTNGAQLMILRGVENLRRCAWIGEEDSAEEVMIQDVEDHAGDSETQHGAHVDGQNRQDQQPDLTEAQDELPPEGDDTEDTGLQTIETDILNFKDHSEERRQDLHELLRQAVKMSKSKKEILRILHTVGRGRSQKLPERIRHMMGLNSDEVLPPSSAETPQGTAAGGSQNKTGEAKTLLKRSVRELKPTEDYDGAFEIFDDVEEDSTITKHGRNKFNSKSKNPYDSVEKMVGGQIFFPEGLKFERGKFNQTTYMDGSNEEEVSSFSSSEEALASCEGVIMALPLVAYRSCSYRWTETNKVVYDIPITGTYYFVFSSDNEISANNLFFNVTLERVEYDTRESQRVCTNTTDCLVPLAFWSNEETLVTVAQEDRWDRSYMLDTTCNPRVPVYLTFLLLAPLLILFCAFQ